MNGITLSENNKKIFKKDDCLYLCLILFEDGQMILESVSDLDDAISLKKSARSGLSEILSVKIFSCLP